jgi:hypothetical protein
MAFSGSAICNSFRTELLKALHNFSAAAGNSYNMALYSNSATLSATTTAYTATGEIPNGNGYTTLGQLMGNVEPTATGAVAFTNFSPDPSWTSATFTARGALIYNVTSSNRSVAVLDFGSDKPVSNGTFTVVMPANVAATALLRLE